MTNILKIFETKWRILEELFRSQNNLHISLYYVATLNMDYWPLFEVGCSHGKKNRKKVNRKIKTYAFQNTVEVEYHKFWDLKFDLIPFLTLAHLQSKKFLVIFFLKISKKNVPHHNCAPLPNYNKFLETHRRPKYIKNIIDFSSPFYYFLFAKTSYFFVCLNGRGDRK